MESRTASTRPWSRTLARAMTGLSVLLLSQAIGAAEPNPNPRLDINRASAEQLAAAIDGVGIKRAEAIVAYRSEHGPFARVDDLANVKGIGIATVSENRDRLRTHSKE